MEPRSSCPGGMPAGNIEVVVADAGWRRLLPRAELLARRAVAATLASEGFGLSADQSSDWSEAPNGARGQCREAKAADAAARRSRGYSVTVLLTDDRAIRRLNAEHRGKDKPTNVLSFPQEVGDHLGDIALALGVVRREAAQGGRRLEAHFAHLVAHGTLHLLGHDHLEAGEARRMEWAEARVMARLRLPNPWRLGRAA